MKNKKNLIKKKKKFNWTRFSFWFVFVLLALSLVFSILMTIIGGGDEAAKSRGDYSLNIIQCLLGLIVLFIPSILNKRLKIELPNYIQITFFLFLFAAIYLGEIRSFYYKIKFWDTILHTISGLMLGALGFFMVDLLNKNNSITLRPIFIALFAFCFSITLGTIWEIYEFIMDGILKLNMQKYLSEDAVELTGRAALLDTMKDIILDVLGALVTAVMGYVYIVRSRKSSVKAFIAPPDFIE